MFSKTNLIYLGLFFAGFAVINTGVYFFLHSTQPKTAVSLAVADAHGAGADSAATTEHHAADPAAIASAPPHSEAPGDVKTEAVVQFEPQTGHTAETAHKSKPRHTEAVPASTAESPIEPAVAESLDDLQASEQPSAESVDTAGAALTLVEDQQKLAKLAKLLESMKPDEAAAIAAELPPDVIVQLVLRMKDRNAAKMMAALPVDMASEVADLMSQVATRTRSGQ